MFTTKSLFSEVPCPNQQNCLLPRCIFSHPKEEANAAGVGASIQPEADVATNYDEARKRRKLTDENVKPGSLASSKHDSSELHEDSPSRQSNASSERRSEKGFLINREISPPPLRKKLQTQTPAPVVKTPLASLTNKTESKPQLSSTQSTPTTKAVSRTPVKTPIKQESLNPRALKSQAPASHDMRFRLLRALHEHFTRLNSELDKDANDEERKFVLSEQELITKALDIEEEATLTPTIYSNVVKNKILVYKRMTVPQWKDERGKELAKVTAAEAAALSDTPGSNPAEPPKPIETGLSSVEEIKLLPRLYTPTAGLSKHGYVTTLPTEQEIEKAIKGVEAAKGWEVCDRCKSRFQVFPGRREEDGSLTSGGACTYHFGKPYWSERSALDPKAKREKRYRCCGQALGDSPGCTKADSHVFKISEVKRMAAVLNFEETPDNQEKLSAMPVCIDGEMGYTVYGLELVRLTATSWPSGDELFDVLVKPIGQILDLNSRYSGVWPTDMAKAVSWDAPPESGPAPKETSGARKLRIVESPAAARALLFSHLSPQTPIIGHGLENDLNATRIIHPTIIDTALLFPHKAGLPFRNGLKMLMHTHLNRHIQVVVDGKMEGHDSKEDANAAGDLVRLSVKNQWQKMQRDGWTLQDGEFMPPPQKPPPTGPRGFKGGLSVEELEREPLSRKRSRDDMEVEDGEVAG